jgi:WD40 repeat protein
LAAAGEGGLIRVWDVASKQLKWQARKAYGAVSALAFTGDSGGLFIGLEDGRLLALRRDSPDPALEIQAHDGPVLAISVCGNGEGIVTGGADESVRLWDVQAGAEVKRLTGHRGKVVSVGFAAGEEYLVSGATDGAVKIWDCEKARCCRTIRMPAEELAVCHVLPDGRRLIMAGAKGSVRVWSLDAGWFSRHFLEPAICRPRTFEELAALHAAFKKSVEDFRKAWHKGHAAEALEHYESAISVPGFSWSKEAILIRNLLHETSRGATLRYSTFVRSFQGHSAAVASVAPSDDSLAVLTGGLDGVAAVWDVVTGRCVKRIDVGSPVKAALFLPRRQGYITWSEDQALRKWDSQGNPAGSVSGVAGPVYLSKDGANVHALSLANRRLRIEISGGLKEEHGAAIPSSACLCFSSDLEHVYSLRDGALIQRWDFSTGRISGAFRDLGVKVSSLTPALADDKVIAGMANGEITVYVVGSGINVSTLRGHSAAVSVISPGPGEDVWVSGSDDCSLRVWDLAGQTCLALLEGHSSPVRAARFFPNASMIVSGGSDGSVRLWGLEWDFTSFRS